MKKGVEINKENYEFFVVDYLEGNLSTEVISLFDSFLMDNPEIAEEIVGLSEVVLETSQQEYHEKHTLKKTEIQETAGINELNYEDKFIGFHEGDLSASEQNKVDLFLVANPDLKKEFGLVGKVKLSPDTKVHYSDKASLKKRRLVLPYYISSAAAILILLGWWYFGIDQKNDTRDIILISGISPQQESVITSLTPDSYNIKVRTINVIPINFIEESEYILRHDNHLSALNSRKFDDEFVSIWDFARILDQNSDFTTLLVSADESIPDQNKVVKKQSLFTSIVSNQWKKLTDGISNVNTSPTKTDDPTYVKVIDQSIRVFNTITGSETYTSKSYDSDGKLTGYQVKGRELMLSRNTRAGSVE